MLTSEKNFLLSQLADVLSNVESLVSKLISVQCEDECPNVPVKVRQEEDVSSVNSQQSLDLLWDNSEDFPVYQPTPSQFYSLFYAEESSDDELNSLESSQFEGQSLQKAAECSFVEKIKSFLSNNFSTNVYDVKKSAEIRQNWLNESVFIEFQSMWRNVDDLFVLNPDSDEETCTTTTPAPIVRYKCIDFTQVNVRSLANIPKPKGYPVHGCALDPELYNPVRMDKHGKYDSTLPCHRNGTAHGFLYGYETDVGIVPVPDIPVHGHVWKNGNWVLHAVDPPDPRSPPRPPWTRPRPRSSTRRTPPSTRSRWPP